MAEKNLDHSMHSCTLDFFVNNTDVQLVESLENESPDNKDDEAPGSIIDEMSRKPEEGLLVESLQALEPAVDGLYRLGIAIRQSSFGNLTQRINAFIQKKDDGMLEAMVFIHLKIKEDAKTEDNENAETVGSIAVAL